MKPAPLPRPVRRPTPSSRIDYARAADLRLALVAILGTRDGDAERMREIALDALATDDRARA